MASTINAKNTSTGVVITPDASGQLELQTADTTRMTITSSGNVGIGTASPSVKFNVTGTSVVANFESTNNANVIGIVYNGSTGGYIGASASTLQFSNSSGTSVAAINSTNFQFNSGYGSVATAYGCRAWVNFNGTGTVAIRASGNVSSITDNGTGTYTVNFTNAMPDANYAMIVTCEPSTVPSVGATYYTVVGGNNANAFTRTTTTSELKTAYVSTVGGASTLWDSQGTHVAFFR